MRHAGHNTTATQPDNRTASHAQRPWHDRDSRDHPNLTILGSRSQLFRNF